MKNINTKNSILNLKWNIYNFIYFYIFISTFFLIIFYVSEIDFFHKPIKNENNEIVSEFKCHADMTVCEKDLICCSENDIGQINIINWLLLTFCIGLIIPILLTIFIFFKK